MSQFSRQPSRMDAVQTPIIDVIGTLIRQTPGTISLGQGIVHYGPPPEALEAARVDEPEALVAGPYLRLWPHRHHTDGFFAAIWQRR